MKFTRPSYGNRNLRAITGSAYGASGVAAAIARNLFKGGSKPRTKKRRGIQRGRKLKYRRGGSRTKTKTSKKGSDIQSISQHNNLLHTRLPMATVGHDKFKTSNPFKYQEIKQYVNYENTGLQAVVLGVWSGTKDQLNGTASANRNEFTKWEIDMFNLNPYVLQSVNPLYPGPMSTTGPMDPDKLGFIGFDDHMSLINLENIATDVQIIWMMCKMSSNNSPIQAWSNALLEEGFTQVPATFQSTLGVLPVLGGQPTYQAYGTHPYELKTFKKWWKIIGSNSVTLQPGDQVNYSRFVAVNRIVSKRFISDQNTAYIANLTVVPLLIIRGSLVGVCVPDATVPVGPKPVSEVTYGTTKIGYLSNREYKFAALGQPRFQTNRVYQGELINSIPTQPLRIINDVDVVGSSVAA